MICPSCGQIEDKVIDTRPSEEGRCIRRRRECLNCGNRFNTVEVVENLQYRVIKKDGSRQDFSKEKLMIGLTTACSKRPVSNEELKKIINEVEARFQEQRNSELSSSEIGEIVMRRLRTLDKVAYVRFASVYRDFTDIKSFTQEIENIIDNS